MAEASQDSLHSQRLMYALRSHWEPFAVNLRTDPMTMEFCRAEPDITSQQLLSLINNVDRVAQTVGWSVTEWRKRDDFIHIVAERRKTDK